MDIHLNRFLVGAAAFIVMGALVLIGGWLDDNSDRLQQIWGMKTFTAVVKYTAIVLIVIALAYAFGGLILSE